MKNPSIMDRLKLFSDILCRGHFKLTFDQLEFAHYNLPLCRRFYLVGQGTQLTLRPSSRPFFPPILQLEPSNMCNLDCLTCATGAGMMKRPGKLMPFEMYQDIIDQVKDYIFLVVFWGWGEPFLNKDALKMIRYTKDQGIFVHTSTNGHFHNSRDGARQIIDSGLDSLVVAVDGLDQHTYEKYRQKGSLSQVTGFIKNLVAERISAGVNHPVITFRFIVMKHNEDQIHRVKAFAENLGVDAVTFRSAVVRRSKLNLEHIITPDSSEFQQFSYEGLPSSEHRTRNMKRYCHRPYANMVVFSNGDVVSCENDFNAGIPLGNVLERPLKKILNSSRSRSFLKSFSKDLNAFPFCRECENHDMKHKTANLRTYILNRESLKRLTLTH